MLFVFRCQVTLPICIKLRELYPNCIDCHLLLFFLGLRKQNLKLSHLLHVQNLQFDLPGVGAPANSLPWLKGGSLRDDVRMYSFLSSNFRERDS